MRRLLAAMTIAIAIGVSGQASAAQPEDFRIFAKTSRVKADPPRYTFREALLSDGERIGRSRLRCRFPRKGKSSCRGVYRLPDGDIEIRGRVKDRKRGIVVPIAGGTEAYAGAAGRMRTRTVSRRKSRVLFDFR